MRSYEFYRTCPLSTAALQTGAGAVVCGDVTADRVLGTAVFGQNIEEAKQSGSRLETDTGSRCWKLEAALNVRCAMLS